MKVGSLEIELVRKNIKNLYIRVYPPNGSVRVVCPQKLDEATVKQFVSSKANWIEKKQAKFQAQPFISPQRYVTGENCYFKGDRFVLNVIYYHAAPKVAIDSTTINLYVRYGSIEEQREQVLTIGDKLSFYASCQAGLGDKLRGGLALLGRGDLTIPKS